MQLKEKQNNRKYLNPRISIWFEKLGWVDIIDFVDWELCYGEEFR